MDVAEIAAVLGLSVKEEEWDRALEMIEKVKAATKGVGEAGKKAGEEAAEGFEKFKETTEMIEKFLETYVGYEGVKTISEMTEHVVSQTMNLQHLSERYGTSIQTLQGFDYMARLTGASLQSVTYAMQRMEFGLHGVSALAGRRGAAGALRQMGISLDTFRKADMQGQLSMLADKFQKMADPNQKIAMAFQLGGRGMVDLIPLLNRGSAAMADLSKEANELGETLDPKQAEAYEEMQAKLQLQWDGLKTKIVKTLMPALDAMQKALSVIMKYFQEHPTELYALLIAIGAAATFVGVATSIMAAKAVEAKIGLKNLWSTAGGLLGSIIALVEAIKWVNEHLGKTPAVITGVVGSLIVLRNVLRSFKGEGLLSQFGGLGGIGKGLLGKVLGGGAAAAEGAVAEGAVAEGAAGLLGGAGLMSLLGPVAAIAGLGYGAYKLYGAIADHGKSEEKAEAPEAQYNPAELEIMRKAGYDVGEKNVTIHVNMPITTAASAEDVKDTFNEEMQNMIREAHKNMGGK